MVAQSGGKEVGPIIPSLEGAIDWQPLSFNPKLNYVYFLSNQWAMGMKFWEEGKFPKPTNGEWFLGADYQQYLSSKTPGNFIAYDVVKRKVAWRIVGPAPFWAGSVATSSGIVFTGDMRGYFLALDARTGNKLWQFQTGSGIIGSPITYELDGVQYVAVPSGGIGGDMMYYYKEPKAGNLWVFALDGGPSREMTGNPLVTRVGAVVPVGQPGSTLGGRVLPGYGFPPTEGGKPIEGDPSLQPTGGSSTPAAPATAASSPAPASDKNPLDGNADAIAQGSTLYRARCFGCHMAAGGPGPKIFKSPLPPQRFLEKVQNGVPGTSMPAFGGLLKPEQIWQIHAFTNAYDRLP
jgi:mono/diheme cytochrome c family protein